MSEYKTTTGDYIITCDDGTGNLLINANVLITGNLTYSNVVTVNSAFITVADGNPGTTLDMGMLAQINANTYAGLRFDVANDRWEISNSVNSLGAPVEPYVPILTTNANLVNPNIGNASGSNLALTGFISAGEAVIANSAYIGNGWANVGNLSASGNVYGNSVVADRFIGGSVVANIIRSNTAISAVGQLQGSDVVVSGVVSGGLISTTGSVTANTYFGDGGNLSNISAGNIIGGYSNANVAGYLPVYGGNIGANGITASIFIGDGGSLSNIQYSNVVGTPAPYGDSNVALFLPTYTGNYTGGNISLTGNVSGSYLLGNGAFIGGLPSGYSDANVATFLAAFGSNSISTTGSVTAAHLAGEGGNISNISWNNITGANTFVAAYLPTDSTIIGINSNVANTNSNVANTNSNVANLASSLANTNSNVANTNSNVANLASSLANTDSNVTVITANLANVWTTIANTDGNVANLTVAVANTDSNVSNLTSNIGNVWIEIGNINGNVSNLGNTVANLSNSTYSNTNAAAFLGNLGSNIIVTTGNISAGYLNTDGVTIANSTITTKLVANVLAATITNITLPQTVSAVTYDWILRSADTTAVSMGKGFVAANATNVAVTYYGNSTVGIGFGNVTVSGTASALTFSASQGTVNGTFILMLTEFL